MHIQTFEPNVFGLYKPVAWTPLQALVALKQIQPELTDAPLTYAGRLDPMAEGLLLVLAGDKVHEKNDYLGLDKTYEVTALLGVETDSFDLLGLPKILASKMSNFQMHTDPQAVEKEMADTLSEYIGLVTLRLPSFSSPLHNGKPLFWWAKNKKISEKDLPARQTRIYDISKIRVSIIKGTELLSYIQSTIPLVGGDFRHAEILSAWNALQEGVSLETWTTLTFTVQCSSGTYIRSLVHDLGKKLGSGACVLRLVRTRVGQYTLQAQL